MQELFKEFPELLARFKDNDEILRAFVFTVWKRTAGQLLNARTKPAEFQNKRLTIAVENVTWKQHLEDLSGEMLYKLNAGLGQGVVTFIEFRVDSSSRNSASENNIAVTREAKTEINAPRALVEAAARIANDGLRDQFLRAAGAYLDRGSLAKT